MSGHSKWATIKRQKGVADAKRSNLFTKLAKNIELAARNGKDPNFNATLRTTIDKARSMNMPRENIERAVLRGAGELPGQKLEEILYEGYGPGGIAILLQAVTDNRNRTSSELRTLLEKHGGKMGTPKSVSWIFLQQGVLRLDQASEELQLQAIDLGAMDVIPEDGGLTLYVNVSDFEKFKKAFPQTSYAEIEWVPAEKVSLGNTEALQKLFDELEESEDIVNFFSNANF